jgi:hypothetical protein
MFNMFSMFNTVLTYSSLPEAWKVPKDLLAWLSLWSKHGTALLGITNAIQRNCNRVDNVLHSLLLRKLSLYFKFRSTAVALVVSYLSD